MAFWSQKDAAPVQSHKFKVDWVPNLGSKAPEPWTVKSVTKPQTEITAGEYQVGNHIFKYPGIQKWNDITLVYVDDKSTTRRLIQMLIDQGWLNPQGQIEEGGVGSEGQDTRKGKNLFQPTYTDTFSEHLSKKGTNSRGLQELHITQHAVVSAWKVYEEAKEGTFTKPPTAEIGAVGTLGEGAWSINGESLLAGWSGFEAEGFLEKWKLKNCWIKSINFGQLDYYSDELINIEIVVSYDYCHIEYGSPDQTKDHR